MNMDINTLEGRDLDKAVFALEDFPEVQLRAFKPSTNWAQGGPIMEREKICADDYQADWWDVLKYTEHGTVRASGPTILIAAMRCYVKSKIGATRDSAQAVPRTDEVGEVMMEIRVLPAAAQAMVLTVVRNAIEALQRRDDEPMPPHQPKPRP